MACTFGQSNMHRGVHLISTQTKQEGNEYIQKLKKLIAYCLDIPIYCVIQYTGGNYWNLKGIFLRNLISMLCYVLSCKNDFLISSTFIGVLSISKYTSRNLVAASIPSIVLSYTSFSILLIILRLPHMFFLCFILEVRILKKV